MVVFSLFCVGSTVWVLWCRSLVCLCLIMFGCDGCFWFVFGNAFGTVILFGCF